MPTKTHLKQWADAKQNRTISVCEVDIKKAICKDHQNCVIAKAIKREVGAEWVDVGANTVLIKPFNSNRYIRYKLSSKAKEQVRFFDHEGAFAPCYVTLNAPSSCQLLGNSKLYNDRRKRKGGPRGERNRTSKPSR